MAKTTYISCPQCGKLSLLVPGELRCVCGHILHRRAPTHNLLPPFKDVLLFGHGGNRNGQGGRVVSSRGEIKKLLRGGYEGDWDFTGDRQAVSVEEYGKHMGFDEEELPRG